MTSISRQKHLNGRIFEEDLGKQYKLHTCKISAILLLVVVVCMCVHSSVCMTVYVCIGYRCVIMSMCAYVCGGELVCVLCTRAVCACRG